MRLRGGHLCIHARNKFLRYSLGGIEIITIVSRNWLLKNALLLEGKKLTPDFVKLICFYGTFRIDIVNSFINKFSFVIDDKTSLLRFSMAFDLIFNVSFFWPCFVLILFEIFNSRILFTVGLCENTTIWLDFCMFALSSSSR